MIKDHPIFIESIRFIRSNLIKNNFNYLENKVLERLVHTSGDFNIQKLLEFSEGACEKAIKSLKEGAPILTDTDMAAAAIKSMAKNTSGNSVISAKKWFNDEIIGTKHVDFFVKRSINYSKKAQSITAQDLF